MRIRHALAALPLLLAACGSDSTTPPVFTLSSGNYVMSSVTEAGLDQCNLTGNVNPADDVFRNGTVVVLTATATSATFQLGSSVDPARNPVCAVSGNDIASGAKTYPVDWTGAGGFDCVESITATVRGSITANNQAEVTLVVNSVAQSGAACTSQNLGYVAMPCTSTIHALLNRQ